MEQDHKAVPIVFITDSKRSGAPAETLSSPSGLEPVRTYASQDDRAGIEEVITFLTQVRLRSDA